jgi:NADH-quinone oxidoreductase subunit M
MTFPFLSIIIFTPVLGAAILWLLPQERRVEARVLAAATAFIPLALCGWLYMAYDHARAGFQFVEQVPWIPAIGASYHVAADGLSLPLILLTGLVLFTGVLVSWNVEDRPRDFFAFLLLLSSGVFGVFLARDLLLLFFAYELAILPMYLLIATWGWKPLRRYAAMKLTLYLLIGSLVALVGILTLYLSAGIESFDMAALQEVTFAPRFQRIWFLPIFLGFGVLAGVWPFHAWSPDGHAAAPTAVSMLHAGVLMKVGAYSALRVAVELLPAGARFWLPYIIPLTLVNVLYGALVAIAQEDLKYVIGFSSVSHMGLVSMGFATLNRTGLAGSAVQMFSHGVMTAMFFAVVGMIYDRAHTRHIPDLGGLARVMPSAALGFVIAGLVSMGMPGLSGFVAEIQVFLGVWEARHVAPWYPSVAIAGALGMLLTAVYILRVTQRVFFGEMPPAFAALDGLTPLDKISLILLSIPLIAIGVYPPLITDLLQSGLDPIITLLGGR